MSRLPKHIYVEPTDSELFVGKALSEPFDDCEEYIRKADLVEFLEGQKRLWENDKMAGNGDHRKGRIRAYKHVLYFLNDYVR